MKMARREAIRLIGIATPADAFLHGHGGRASVEQGRTEVLLRIDIRNEAAGGGRRTAPGAREPAARARRGLHRAAADDIPAPDENMLGPAGHVRPQRA
jgi:hypothetical protein